MPKQYLVSIMLLLFFTNCVAQQQDNASQKWNLHVQATAITQYHLPFSAKYSGTNSLMTEEPARTSITGTIYAGLRLWKNAAVYFNPEVAGGKGLSQVTGIAGFTNGETFRIGTPSLKLYLARLYLEQYFSLGKSTETVANEANQLKGTIPLKYILLQAGKFSVSDFYDNNSLSNDPRTQFMNWSLMSTGGWDYPANTRGYTIGLSVGYHQPSFSLKGAITQEPEVANGPVLDNNIGKAFGTVIEAEKIFTINKSNAISVRVAGFYNQAHAGNYDLSVKNAIANFTTPDITSTGIYSRSKAGFYINTEYNFTNGGVFLVGSWNDGKNETWAFTEIDHSVSTGLSLNGTRWNRNKDVFGIAVVFNGLSKQHSNYLKQGGYGFMMGDGTLNYGLESILETYYSFQLPLKFAKVFITPNYQFVLNPAYNKDRGPVHIVALRLHVAI